MSWKVLIFYPDIWVGTLWYCHVICSKSDADTNIVDDVKARAFIQYIVLQENLGVLTKSKVSSV